MLPQPFPILIQIAVGFIAGFFYVRIMKKPVFGNLWGAVAVGIPGSVLGGFFLDRIFGFLVLNPLTVDFVATFFGSFLLIWLFSKLAHQ